MSYVDCSDVYILRERDGNAGVGSGVWLRCVCAMSIWIVYLIKVL